MGQKFVPEIKDSSVLLRKLKKQHESGNMFTFEVAIKQILENQISIMKELRK